MALTTDPRDIAPICEAIQAPVVAARGPAPLQAKGGRARLLKTESGRVVTHGEVMGALLARAEIEVAVVDGKRPEWIACEVCKVPVKVPPNGGPIPTQCKVCAGKICTSCGAPRAQNKSGGSYALCVECVKARSKARSTCKCGGKKNPRSMQCRKCKKSEAKAIAKKYRDRFCSCGKQLRPEARSKNCGKCASALREARKTPEQKARLAELARNQLSPDERRELARKGGLASGRAKKAAESAP